MSAREVIALQEFARWAIREGAFQAADLDGLSIQEKAHELGLIEATTYDPERCGPSDCAEPGDEWFTFAPSLTASGYVILSPDEVRGIRDEASRIAELKAELDLLQDILDSRPAINTALPDSYIRWSQAIYSGDAIRSLKGGRDAQ